MAIVEALKSAQFVVNSQGEQKAVLLDIQAWETLINWIENVIDTKIATQALVELQMAGGRPHKAGWLAGYKIREDWDDEAEAEIKTDRI